MPESAKVRHYKDLKIWQKGMNLARAVYKFTSHFPADERFGLTVQMRRAAVSVPSNIAGGQARRGTREFLQFLSHASGSLAELETQVLLSIDLGYCKEPETVVIVNEISEIQKMIGAIRAKLVSRATNHSPLATPRGTRA